MTELRLDWPRERFASPSTSGMAALLPLCPALGVASGSGVPETLSSTS